MRQVSLSLRSAVGLIWVCLISTAGADLLHDFHWCFMHRRSSSLPVHVASGTGADELFYRHYTNFE